MFKKLISGIIIVIFMTMLIGCDNMKFDQETRKNDLLTKEYTIAQLEALKSAAETDDITFSKFKRRFDVQCMRKTHQGYYVVLLLEDSGNAFVFFNEKNILLRVMIVDNFITQEEFEQKITKQMPQSEVLNWDSNAIIAPISALEVTAHIVREGVFIVQYSRFIEGEVIEDPIVSSILFIENESISTNEDLFIKYEVPFIFEFDKTDKQH